MGVAARLPAIRRCPPHAQNGNKMKHSQIVWPLRRIILLFPEMRRQIWQGSTHLSSWMARFAVRLPAIPWTWQRIFRTLTISWLDCPCRPRGKDLSNKLRGHGSCVIFGLSRQQMTSRLWIEMNWRCVWFLKTGRRCDVGGTVSCRLNVSWDLPSFSTSSRTSHFGYCASVLCKTLLSPYCSDRRCWCHATHGRARQRHGIVRSGHHPHPGMIQRQEVTRVGVDGTPVVQALVVLRTSMRPGEEQKGTNMRTTRTWKSGRRRKME